MSEDFDRVICYSPDGATELDGWYIHLIVQPMHRESGGAYRDSGDEVIHLFYGEQELKPQVPLKSSEQAKPRETQDNLRAAADQVFGTYGSEGVEPFFLRVAADGRTDNYTVEPFPFHTVLYSTGYLLETEYDWTPLTEEEVAAVHTDGAVLQIWNTQEGFDIYAGSNILHWTERGSGAEHWLRGVAKGSYPPLYDYLLEEYARGAELDRPLREIAVPGTVADYEEVARQVAEQYAAILRLHHVWCQFTPYDAAVTNTNVFDAYYGEDYPNFCFGMGLALKVDERNKDWFEAGTGFPQRVLPVSSHGRLSPGKGYFQGVTFR